MSSTCRGAKRVPLDNYPTPAWCVRRLLEAVDLPVGLWLEPACGDGAIIHAVDVHFGDMPMEPTWDAVDVRGEHDHSLRLRGVDFCRADFLEWAAYRRRYDVAITNPPYSIAGEFIAKCRAISDVTVMLLRINYLASEKRADMMRSDPPDVYVLPDRPKFVGGKADSCEYAWFVWGQSGGRLRVLATTPLDERKADEVAR